MLNAITEKKPFVLGTRYGAGVEMDEHVINDMDRVDFSGLCIDESSLQEPECLLVL